MKRIAILGGGYAGMAAALELSAQGFLVTVFEAGKVLGGRARAVTLDEQALDNGQHLVMGAYSELLRLIALAGGNAEQLFLRQNLQLEVEPGFRLACPYLPAPLHLAVGLALARGLGFSARWRLIRLIRKAQGMNWHLAQDCSVESWLQAGAQPADLVARFWQPLTVAALNTPLAKASAQVLLNVLRDSLGGKREASDLLFPRVDFSALFPNLAAQYVQRHQGEVRLGRMVKKLSPHAGGWLIGDETERFDGVVCALPPHRAGMVLQELPELHALVQQLSAWEYQPIITVYLQYAAHIGLPRPMTGLADSIAQWVFDRNYSHATPGLIAVVISAEGQHQQLSRAALIQAVQAELHQRLGLPEQAQWHGMIAEKLATFSCTPGMQRPANRTGLPGLWLAGDYTAGESIDYPATLEGAVRSGVAAACAMIRELNV